MRKPYVVSLGAQKNFAGFNSWLKEQEHELEPFFKQTVALLILWRDAEKIVRKQGFEGYRHNIVTYTLAWLFELTQSRMDLKKIWREQKSENAVLVAIEEMCQIVEAHIKHTNQNVTEWCKKEECWRTLLEKEYTLPDGIVACFMDERPKDQRYDSKTCDEREAEEFCKDKGSKAWIELSTWAKQRNFLTGKARSQCFNMGNFLDRGREPSMASPILVERLGRTPSCWDGGGRKKATRSTGMKLKVSQITELANPTDISIIRNQIPGFGRNRGYKCINMLLKSIEDKDDYTRCIAAKCLGKFCDPAAVNILINSLKDESSAVRKQSALALGRLGDIRSRPYLIDALKDEDRSVRKAAKKSLSKIDRLR